MPSATSTPDFFSFLGLSRRLKIDTADLEQRYRALSRQFHPDYFYNAPPAERRASLERSSYLNDAYRTLKNPVSRIEYLLKLEGVTTAASATPPASLLEEVFELNEELDQIRDLRSGGASEAEWKTRLERARAPIEQKRIEHAAGLEALTARWDAVIDRAGNDTEQRDVLNELRERILERNYINNLLAGIERELAEPS